MDKTDSPYFSSAPSVSVVIPLFNGAAFIARAIDSVLTQTYPVKEIIVVDDGSTDRPEEVLKSYEKNIRYLRTENSGAAHARNVGVKAATGELIAFLDADDEWLPKKLEQQIKVLLGQSCALVYCGRTDINALGKPLAQFEQSEYPQGKILSKLIAENHISSASVVLVRKSVFEAAGGFCEEDALEVSEDFELWCRIALHHEIGAVPERLIRYRLHGANITENKTACYRGKIAALNRLLLVLEALPNTEELLVLKGQIRDKRLKTHHHYAWGFAQQGEYAEARRALGALYGTVERLEWPLRAVQWFPDRLLSIAQRLKRVLRRA